MASENETELSSESSDEEASEYANEDSSQQLDIRQDLKSMSFEDIMKLKEELGSKVYKEAVLGISTSSKTAKSKKQKSELKRLNKNRPREMSSKRQVPFLGGEHRSNQKQEKQIRDPRFDERTGTYDVDSFKQNYKFLSKIREKEVAQLKKQLNEETVTQEKDKIRHTMQRLINKNVEDRKWRIKSNMLKKEKEEIQKAHNEGRRPHYVTKKERRAKELVMQFEHLKKTGKLDKHLEKRRKKNASKDRKKLGFD